VLRTDLGSQKIAAGEHELQIQQLREQHDEAEHDWAREEQRLIQAIEKTQKDNKWNEKQWAKDKQAHEAELKSATEIMEAAEDVIGILEEELADMKGLLGSDAASTDHIIDHFKWFGRGIEGLTNHFAIDGPSAPITTLFNPVDFPSQDR